MPPQHLRWTVPIYFLLTILNNTLFDLVQDIWEGLSLRFANTASLNNILYSLKNPNVSPGLVRFTQEAKINYCRVNSVASETTLTLWAPALYYAHTDAHCKPLPENSLILKPHLYMLHAEPSAIKMTLFSDALPLLLIQGTFVSSLVGSSPSLPPPSHLFFWS